MNNSEEIPVVDSTKINDEEEKKNKHSELKLKALRLLKTKPERNDEEIKQEEEREIKKRRLDDEQLYLESDPKNECKDRNDNKEIEMNINTQPEINENAATTISINPKIFNNDDNVQINIVQIEKENTDLLNKETRINNEPTPSNEIATFSNEDKNHVKLSNNDITNETFKNDIPSQVDCEDNNINSFKLNNINSNSNTNPIINSNPSLNVNFNVNTIVDSETTLGSSDKINNVCDKLISTVDVTKCSSNSNEMIKSDNITNINIVNTNEVIPQISQPKQSKKITFSEAKKEIEEFSTQIQKYEEEIREKYGINLSEFYVEDLLPEELKIKLIDDFFNSQEVSELLKKNTGSL